MMPLMAGGSGKLGTGSFLQIDETQSFPTSAHSGVTFNSDGTTTVVGALSTPENWFGPPLAGIGASYWLKITKVSGTIWTSGVASGSVNRLDTSPNVQWAINSPSTPTIKDANVRFDFYSDAGTTLVGSWTVNTICEST